MGLQIRLRHALGERLFELPDRTAESPLIVGRSREAEVKIPSVTVAARHCALFLHENRWVLQDSSGGYTWVNENAVEGPTPLSIGDIITMGSDTTPATLEIDPAAVAQGRTGEPAETDDVRAPAAPVAAPMASATTSARSASRPPGARPEGTRPPQGAGYYAAPAASSMNVPPPPAAASWEAPAGGEDSIEGWGQPAAATTGAAASTQRRKKKQSSNAGVIVGIGVCVAIVIGVAVFVFQRLNPAPPPKKADGTKKPKVVYGKQASIFSEHQEGETVDGTPSNGSTPSPSPSPSPTPSNTPDSTTDNTPSNDTPPPSADAHKDDPAWEQVQAANDLQDIGTAILRFDDYRKQHPGINSKELDAYTDAAMDRLWWKRIVGLCEKRSQLQKDIKAKDKDIKDEPSPAFKKTLKDERDKLDKELQITITTLTKDMNYTAEESPDVDNKEMLARLTSDRDPGKFRTWKMQTLSFIRSHHGSMPWDS